jgi:hypothetical protein
MRTKYRYETSITVGPHTINVNIRRTLTPHDDIYCNNNCVNLNAVCALTVTHRSN